MILYQVRTKVKATFLIKIPQPLQKTKEFYSHFQKISFLMNSLIPKLITHYSLPNLILKKYNFSPNAIEYLRNQIKLDFQFLEFLS